MGDWSDLGTPVDAAKIAGFPDFIRALKGQLRDRLAKEHVVFGDAALSGGEHKEGSALVYLSDTEPTTKPDGTNLDADDKGRLWLDYSGSYTILKVYDGTDWVTVVYGTVSIYNESIVNAKLKEAVEGAGGAVDTNVINDDAITTPLILDENVTNAKLADVDGEGANGAVSTTKINNDAITTDKIVNNAITTDKILNEAVTQEKLEAGILTWSWVTLDFGVRTPNECIWLAHTNGIFIGTWKNSAGYVLTDSNNPPTTARWRNVYGSGAYCYSFISPIKAGDYFKLDMTSTETLTAYFFKISAGDDPELLA